MKKVCESSGRSVQILNYLNGKFNEMPYQAICPKCDRTLKAKHAGGGHEGYANYWYLPTHKREI